MLGSAPRAPFHDSVAPDPNLESSRPAASPCGHPHVGLRGVRATDDDLGRGMAVSSPVHFVLDNGEELLRGFGAGIVVHAGGVNVDDLAPEDALRRTNVSDPGEQLVEVVAAAGLLQPLIVYRKRTLTRYSRSRAVAHWRNWVLRAECTR